MPIYMHVPNMTIEHGAVASIAGIPEGSFRLDTFNIGIHRSVSMVVGDNTNSESGGLHAYECAATKRMDGSTAALKSKVLVPGSGENGVKVFLTNQSATGKGETIKTEYTFDGVRFTSYHVAAESSGDPIVSFTFIYTQSTQIFNAQTKDGDVLGGAPVSLDIATGESPSNTEDA